MLTQSIGFIGAGQMARALARGFVASGLTTGQKIAYFDPVEQAGRDFAQTVAGSIAKSSNRDVASVADIIFLAVKPQNMTAVLTEIGGALTTQKLVISVAAGVTLPRLIEGLKTDRVIRVMPNTPALVGQGASAYAMGPGATSADSQLVRKLLSAVGIAYQVDEKLLDAVTGLSGSGPAFVYVMIEALSDAGVKMGLTREVAAALAAQTVRGAAEMVLTTGEHPAALKDNVASPGGTTIAGLSALETHGLRAALIAAVEAATRRSQELGKA